MKRTPDYLAQIQSLRQSIAAKKGRRESTAVLQRLLELTMAKLIRQQMRNEKHQAKQPRQQQAA